MSRRHSEEAGVIPAPSDEQGLIDQLEKFKAALLAEEEKNREIDLSLRASKNRIERLKMLIQSTSQHLGNWRSANVPELEIPW